MPRPPENTALIPPAPTLPPSHLQMLSTLSTPLFTSGCPPPRPHRLRPFSSHLGAPLANSCRNSAAMIAPANPSPAPVEDRSAIWRWGVGDGRGGRGG